MSPVKRLLIYSAFVPASLMLISLGTIFLAFVGGFLSNSVRNDLFFFSQYATEFHTAFKTTSTSTIYVFPFRGSWIVSAVFWIATSLLLGRLMRDRHPMLAIAIAPAITFGLMLLLRLLITTSGYQITLEGL